MLSLVEKTSDRKVVILSIIICVLVVLFHIWKYRYFLHNDTWITLRYVINFVELGDLSWNPGERVEGYTEPLHLLLLSILVFFGFAPIFAAQGLNLFCAIALSAAVFIGARKISESKTPGPIEAIALIGVVTAPPTIVWIFGGLGALLAASLSAWAIVQLMPAFVNTDKRLNLIRLSFNSGVLFALAYLARPDAVVMLAASCISVFLFAQAPLRQRIMAASILGIVPSIMIVAHVCWRYFYYGEIAPNTYYAKVGIDGAVRLFEVPTYLLNSFMLSLMPVSLGILGSLIWAYLGKYNRSVTFLLLCIVFHTIYVIWSGGDHMPAARVLLPLLAPGCLLLAYTVKFTPPKQRATVLVMSLVPMMLSVLTSQRLFEDGASWVGSIVGTYINEAWPDDALVASNSAGALVFLAREKTFIDMLGLNDRTIGKREGIELLAPKQHTPGHSKGDGAYVLSKKPDYIIVGRAQGMRSDEAWFLSGYEMNRMPEFHKCYEVQEVEIDLERLSEPLEFVYYERICEK